MDFCWHLGIDHQIGIAINNGYILYHKQDFDIVVYLFPMVQNENGSKILH